MIRTKELNGILDKFKVEYVQNLKLDETFKTPKHWVFECK